MIRRARLPVQPSGFCCVVVPAYIKTVYADEPKMISERRLANYFCIPFSRCATRKDRPRLTPEEWAALPVLHASPLHNYDDEPEPT
jgi:hypothetical protein